MAETKNEVISSEVKKAQPGEKRFNIDSKSLVIFVLLAAVFFSLLCAAFVLGKRADDRTDLNAPRFDSGRMMMRDDSGGRNGGMRGGMMGDSTDSNESATTSTRVMGVVTAVDGDTITVAGNGATTKVTVSDNTTYSGDEKPAKVNDTIMAFGARDSGDNLVASTVRLTRQ